MALFFELVTKSFSLQVLIVLPGNRKKLVKDSAIIWLLPVDLKYVQGYFHYSKCRVNHGKSKHGLVLDDVRMPGVLADPISAGPATDTSDMKTETKIFSKAGVWPYFDYTTKWSSLRLFAADYTPMPRTFYTFRHFYNKNELVYTVPKGKTILFASPLPTTFLWFAKNGGSSSASSVQAYFSGCTHRNSNPVHAQTECSSARKSIPSSKLG